ncbi:MAG TPA: NAD(+) diphosphatase [Streptosporangiaceae bacterium]
MTQAPARATPPAFPRLPYTGRALDRAAGQRGDGAWLDGVRTRPGTRLVPLWRDRCLVTAAGAGPVTLPLAGAADLLAAADPPVFLGLDDSGAGVFAADLSALDEAVAAALAGAAATADTRSLFAVLDADQATALAYARGLLRWHRDQQFCGRCGAQARPGQAGHQRTCTGAGCGKLLFPRIEPAVITLVEAPAGPPRCLLARPATGPDGVWSLIAGFVDVGEGLEDAVRREVAEETGVSVGQVRYLGSQAWPYPAGLMIGFRAVATGEAITVDQAEVAEARWVTRPELAAYLGERPRRYRDSIGLYLLEGWLEEAG